MPDKGKFIIDTIMLFLKSYNPISVVGKSRPFLGLRKVSALLQEERKVYLPLL
jgi:hypothetical protein